MLKHQHKTLARTLDYIACHSPAEFGLFWDADGTMPWKDFYWALQQDPHLRFVREANITELTLLGIELPFVLDGTMLRLKSAWNPYKPALDLPKRLFYGIRSKELDYIQKFGIKGTRRPLLPLSSDRELALRIARRRETDPIILEIRPEQASLAGVEFFFAGPQLYLADAVPSEFLIFPLIKLEVSEKLAAAQSRKQKPKTQQPASPGSFIVEPQHIEASVSGKSRRQTLDKNKKGWKKESRKERHKRDI